MRELIAEAAGDGASVVGPHWASGYALASSPLLASCDLGGTGFSYNQSGGSILITKPAGTTGRYFATFNVGVRCFAPNGTPADIPFMVLLGS